MPFTKHEISNFKFQMLNLKLTGLLVLSLVVAMPSRAQDFVTDVSNNGTGGVGTAIHYPVPPHLSGAYTAERQRFGSLPITEHLAATALSLPISAFHTDDEVARVIDAVRSFEG